jgi:hypothetical protein
MDKAQCRHSPLLHICNEREVDALATALNCVATDIYEAVAFVGDRTCCIGTYIEKRIERDVPPRPLLKLCALPPVWEETTQ